jgi:MFS transporter, OCT family, solute carrier family 22 (organic cation transporter), member 4/5
MGCVSVFGGIIGLRLPETLHHHIPQTLAEGEEFGKNWTCQDYFRCIPLKPDQSPKSSYVNLKLDTTLEMNETKSFKGGVPNETTPLDANRRVSMRRLARQSSFMDTQKNKDGAMQLTYWF